MSWFQPIRERWRALWGREELDEEMDDELRFHLEMETGKNLRAGFSPEEARRQARIAFGGVERFKEQARGERGVRPLEDFIADLRFSFRTLRKSPGFTAVAVISLALGIGANTAIFSIVNAMLVRDLPFEAPGELVNIYRDRARGSFDPLNYPDFLEIRDGAGELFADLGGYQYALAQRETDGGVEAVVVEMVTGSYMPLLGIRPALGRTLLPEDHVAPGAHPVLMLGHRYWQTAFGGDPGVLGQTVLLSGRGFTIVGVVPESFPGSIRGVAPEFFAPIMMISEVMPSAGNPLESRGTNAFMPVGRLREGATVAQARVALTHVAEDLKVSFPGIWDEGDEFRALPTEDVLFNPGADRAVVLVNFLALGVVGLVLLIACANLAGFLLARGVDRRKEVALRLALGATRGRLIRQLLTETLVLAVLGGAVGIPLALWILEMGLSTTLPFPLPLGLDLSLDWTVLVFTLGISLGTGVLVGLLPAFQATRPELAPTLKDEGAGGEGSRVLALSRYLVVGQMAMSVVLLVVAGLFIRSFGASRLLDPGFGQEPTAVLTFMVPSQSYPAEEGRALLASVMEEARALPGVSRVAAISNIHLNPLNSMFLDVNVEGVPAPSGRNAHIVDFTSVSAGFFATAGIPLLEGRDFDISDREDGAPVAIINQAMADRFWPQGSALGQTIIIEIPEWENPTVVGVVATAKIHSLGEAATPFLYLPYAQEYNALVSVLAVTENPGSTANGLYRMVRERHPDLIVNGSNTLEEHVGVMLIFSRLSALLSSVFAGMALGLSVIGLYGVVSYAVVRRSKEMGIRLSLGAAPWGVVALQMKDGMRLVLLGGGLGVVLATLAARGLVGLLVGVPSFDPVAFAGAVGILALVALLATFVPARRASRVNPVKALKSE
jgi:predicted permease